MHTERSGIQERLNLMLASVDRSVIPLYALFGRREGLKTIGSAVLVRRRDGTHLVVSAGHVIDNAAGKALFTMGGDTTGLLQLRGDGYVSEARQGDRNQDKVDIAAFAIDETVADQLRAAEAAFVGEAILSDETDRDAIYAFAGFPLRINKFRKEREPDGRAAFVIPHQRLVIYARPAEEAAYVRTGTDPALNLVADFKHQRAQYYDSATVGFPHPKGMSGGAVFRMKSTSRTAFRSAEINLVGIGIEYHEKPGLLVAANARAMRILLRSFGA